MRKKRNTDNTNPNDSKKKGGAGRLFRKLFLFILIVSVLLSSVVAGAMLGFIDNSTDLISQEYNLDFTSMVYYIDKETNKPVEVDRLYSEQNRIWVDLDKIPVNLKKAFIAIEDERFEKHRGVDWKRTVGAFVTYFFKGNQSYGGSTITQQLIKNVTGDDRRSPIRKVQEIVRALNLERKMSKDQIIEMYMNTIYLGQGCHGVQSAANVYYSKDVSKLTLEECASIAGITQYPSKYDPLVNYEEHKKKQEIVLDKMEELGYISAEESKTAKAAELNLKKGTAKTGNTKIQSYFIDQVVSDVINDLITKHKMSESNATKELYKGGLKIYTTMDPNVQNAVEEVFTNQKNFPSTSGDKKPESAMIILDPYTGQIKGMVGGRGTKQGNRVLNRATQTLRQPGSAIKPLSVYAPAVENGLVTPATIVQDSQLTIGDWTPKNSYRGFKGNVTVRSALEQSMNIPAVRILDKLSVEKSFDFLTKNLGFTTLVSSEKRKDGKTYSDRFYSSLALGGFTDGVSVEEVAAAFQPFVNKGVYTKTYTYTKVIDAKGRVILENKPETINAMSETTAYTVAQMLSGVIKYGTGTSAKLNSNVFAGGKTGTTSDDKDRWFVGFTPYYVGAVWFGYDSPKAMTGLGNPSTSLWKKVMDKVHQKLPAKTLDQPSHVVERTICQVSGKIATGQCTTTRVDYFRPGTQPVSFCASHADEQAPEDKLDDNIQNANNALNENLPGSGAQNPPAEGEAIKPTPAPSGQPSQTQTASAKPQIDPGPNEETLDWWSGE